LEIGKRWDFGHFFFEPQGQIEGAWAGGTDHTVSNGLAVNADSQTSLRGRLGLRVGHHIDCGSKAFEPYAKVSVINEFLGGDRITSNQTAFFPTLSGVGIQAAGGITARITDSIYSTASTTTLTVTELGFPGPSTPALDGHGKRLPVSQATPNTN
jgi:outer membrane autotransporter protein